MRTSTLRCDRPALTRALFALLAMIMAGPLYAVDYFDDFDRADSANLGDGWIEKQPLAFSIASGEATKNLVVTAYRDNIVYRPAAEDLVDAEASIEAVFPYGNVGYPQIFVRVQADTVAQANRLDGYILYLQNSATSAVVGRQTGTSFVTTLGTLFLSEPINTTDTYRLRLRATGTDPVAVEAWIERANGPNWDVLAQASVTDSSAQRITTAGAVGFGGYIENDYIYDNFNRVDLEGGGGPPPDNPVPATTALLPDTVDEGSPNLTLTVQGTDFVADTVVRWNGADRPTTYVSESEVTAEIAAADLANAGVASVTTFNPAPGGGISNAQTFTIAALPGNPIPDITAIAPDNAVSGDSGFLLVVNGSGFIPESVVRWDGADRQTGYVNATQITATITAADIAASGSYDVSVFNPAPGGGTSNDVTFTVTDPIPDNPAPVVTAMTPSSVTEGSSAFTLAVDGQDFIADSIVRWNGADRTTTFVSATRLEAAITGADVATAGTADVTVFTPAPGGGTSAVLTFTIDADTGGGPGGGQSLADISPQVVQVGSGAIQLTLNGSGYTNDSVAQLEGIALPTTFIDESQLVADVDAGLLSAEIRAAITVRTPGASNVVTLPQTLFTVGAGENVFFDNFNRADNPDLENEWTEKQPQVFSIDDEAVSAGYSGPMGFNHLVTYRPLAEDTQDVEVGMEFTRDPGADSEYPQVHARIQRDTVANYGSLSSYTLFFANQEGNGVLNITPINDYYECYLATWGLSQPFVEGDRYRLRFRVTGTDPVTMVGYLDHLNVDYWEVVAAGTILHDNNTQPQPGLTCDNPGGMIPPITGMSANGFSKYRDASDNYDNFYAIRLGAGSNPAPVTTAITPNSAVAGSAAQTLTVQGSSFTNSSVVRWGGSDRPTTFVSATELQVDVTAGDLASAGTTAVTVFTPAPGGGLSNAQVFTVTDPASNPVPNLTALTPDMVVVSSAGFTLVVEGSDFVDGAIVRWNGADRVTSFVSDTQLQAAINADDIDSAGTANVSVYNPMPGGGTSNVLSLTILDPGTDYFDDFSRPDGNDLGSGWIEKQGAAFSIVNGTVVKNGVTTGYRDNYAYRPAAEDALDVEASVEFEAVAIPIGYPQLFVRLQSDTAATPNVTDAYMMYLENSQTRAVLGRQNGASFVTTLSTMFLSEPINTTDRYRMRLSATGTDPVVVNATIERLGGSGWEIIGQASAADSAANRIDTPGSVGFGGYIEDSYTYDNFVRLYLGTGP